jgi:AAA domain
MREVPITTPIIVGNEQKGSDQFTLKGRSLVEFSELEIDESLNLLGNRWLERKQWNAIVAPAGQGKSVSSVQAAILWSCGKTAFGIPTPILTGLRVLVVQHEDNDNDMVEMATMIDHLGLTEHHKNWVARNSLVYQVKGYTGPLFVGTVLAKLVEDFKPDLLILNPLNRYIGGDERDPKVCGDFIDALDALMERFNFGALVIHHTPKTNFNSTVGWRSHDWQYGGAGHAKLTNNPRGQIFIQPIANGVYRFIAGKRGGKIGWDNDGEVYSRYFKHSRNTEAPVWEDATPSDVQASLGTQQSERGQTAKILDPEAILAEVPATEVIENEALVGVLTRKFNCGEKPVLRVLAELVHEGRLFETSVKTKKGKGRGRKAYTKVELVDAAEPDSTKEEKAA